MKNKIESILIFMLLVISIFSAMPIDTIAVADSKPPELSFFSISTETFGFGHNTSISSNVYDNDSGIDVVKINITYPDDSFVNASMSNIQGATYEYNFTDSWLTGQYNYSIWVRDNSNNTNISSQSSFNISAEADISLSTIKNIYYDNETINLTDPPSSSISIGYELLDDSNVLHIWNSFDHYYFDTDSGIQLTNHKDEYWSHNVLMLGYYNNDEWNLMYRTDELSGFNKNIDTDNITFINITLWKDLNYNGYDFRLAICYYLGVDDNELTVIPYIKNLDTQDIPYVLGFGWEMNDIQIDGTVENDYIWLNSNETYLLNQTLDTSYTNLSEPVYWFNETSNQTEIIGYNDPTFYLMEDIDEGVQKSLYLRWDKDLTYKLQVKSENGEYNAPVTLFVRIGILNSGQEKYTEMFWYDASQNIYYFDDYDQNEPNEAWEIEPGYMVDGNTGNFASTVTSFDVELLDGNTYSSGGNGTILKVEIRAHGYFNEGEECVLIVRPVFSGGDGSNHYFYMAYDEPEWSSWFDITSDTNTPGAWFWSNISSLKCDIESDREEGTYYCSKVEIRVTYNNDPIISNPVPADDSINVSISPTLSIDVSDPDGDLMNVTWYSNCSGSWVAFGSNTSVSNGTYSQVFSNASVNGQWWYWRVYVSDSATYIWSDIYCFYTGLESKLENTGSTNISGYLMIQVQYYSDTIDDWVVDHTTIKENTTRTINAGGYLALDTIFNGKVNSSDLIFWNGTYRVFAALCDPAGNVLKDNDDCPIFQVYTIAHFRSCPVGWRCLEVGGFGRVNNIATRGVAVYNDELYIGTESYNKDNLGNIGSIGFAAGTKITLANNSLKNIEDLDGDDVIKAYDIGTCNYVNASVLSVFNHPSENQPDSYVKINNNLCLGRNQTVYVNQSFIIAQNVTVGNILKDVNLSNVTVSLTQNKYEKSEMYHIELKIDVNDTIPNNLTFFANDIQVYPWTLYDDSINLDTFDATSIISRWEGSLFSKIVTGFRSKLSDGCELWKYNYNNNVWTEVIGPSHPPEGTEYSGFGTTDNIAISSMIVFNGELYVGTWNNAWNGAQIWRYDGLDWDQVINDGFDTTLNMGISCFKIFEDTLYAGTINADLTESTGGCQLWRTTDGDDWEKVVNRGFKDFDEPGFNTRNLYLWIMEEFDGNLYAGTFNAPSTLNTGCQLYRSDTGDDDWEKVTIPNAYGILGGDFRDGFGDWQNYGIRNMMDWNGYLYIGVAANAMGGLLGNEPEAIEIWRFDGTNNDVGAWECIVGDDSGKSGEWEDGFGDTFNKYPWSMELADNKLWIGTSNVQWLLNGFQGLTNGLEVWCYDGTDLTPIVEDDGGEIESGFMEVDGVTNGGARPMIQYPVDSGKIVVGTMRVNSYVHDVQEYGCQVWIRES